MIDMQTTGSYNGSTARAKALAKLWNALQAEHNGATVNLETGDFAGSQGGRYVVGGLRESVVIHRNRLTFDLVRRYVEGCEGFVGFWIDATGRVWLDEVEFLNSLEAAKLLAFVRGEIAIYDLESNKEITVSR